MVLKTGCLRCHGGMSMYASISTHTCIHLHAYIVRPGIVRSGVP